jgi:DNA gyrase subunit A
VPITQLVSLDPQEQITAALAADFTPNNFLLLITRQGKIKKTKTLEFASLKGGGLGAIDLDKGDELVTAKIASDRDEVIVVTTKGRAIRFPLGSLRATSRKSAGVGAIKLDGDDRVVRLDIIYPGAFLLVVSSNGFGKLTPIDAFPCQARRGRGILAHKTTDRTGEVVAARLVSPGQELMIISAMGNVIRSPVGSIPIRSRKGQGISLMKLNPGDRVASTSCFDGRLQ